MRIKEAIAHTESTAELLAKRQLCITLHASDLGECFIRRSYLSGDGGGGDIGIKGTAWV